MVGDGESAPAGNEQARIFRRYPLVVGYASELARAGDFVTVDAAGVPLLMARDGEGRLRAFVNVCRHRATRVETATCGHDRQSFVCPLHGWTYGLGGELAGLPEDQGFGFVDRARMSLVQVRIAEAFGLVWVLLRTASEAGEADLEMDLRAFVGDLASALEPLNLGSRRALRGGVLADAHDWKTALGALLGCDPKATIASFGPHIEVRSADGVLVMVAIFPNTVILVEGEGLAAFQVFPAPGGGSRLVGARLLGEGHVGEPRGAGASAGSFQAEHARERLEAHLQKAMSAEEDPWKVTA